MEIRHKRCWSHGPSVTLGLLILAISSVEMKTIPRRRLEKPRIVSGVATNSYNFPYFCAVQMYIDHPEDPNWKPIYRLLGSGTILSKKSVLFSVNILARYLYHFKDRSYQVSDINIVAGSGFLQPTVREGAVQIGRGKRLVISERKRPFAADYIEEHKVGILDGKLNASWFRTLETNALGDLQNEVALLLLNQDLFLSPYIIPAPLISFSLNEIRAAMKPIMEADYLGPDRYGPCVVPGWGPLGENQLMSHRVFHIPFSDCQETICAQIPSACLDYPQRFNHICFKSDSYGDVCVYDQGAPLFCPWFQDSVIAILVRAFDCGLTGLPGVYALIDRVLDVPQIFGVKFEDNTWKNRRHFPWNKNDLREKVTPNYKF